MKTLIASITFAALLCGCTSTVFEKSITVTKDANGNVVSTSVTEKAIQPGRGWEMDFEILKGVKVDWAVPPDTTSPLPLSNKPPRQQQ